MTYELQPLGPRPVDAAEPKADGFEQVELDLAPATLAEFVELVEQQLVAALERSRSGLDERSLTAAAVGWFRRRGADLDTLAMFHWILRASGVRPDPHHARLGAAATLACVATEIERDPDEGPWALARPVARQACARELMRMASRLAQGEPSCAELIDAHAEVLQAPEQRPRASSSPPALELLCTCAALAAGVDEDRVDAFATAGDATARIAWWLEELRRLLRPLDRAGFEARRAGPVLRLFAEVSSFEQREELVALLDDLPHSLACLHEFLYRSGLVGRCAEAIEQARREVHEQLAEVAASTPGRVAGLRNWLIAVDGLAAHLYRVPELPCSARLREAEGPWTRLVHAALADLDERLARSPTAQPLPRPRLRAWGAAEWIYDPMRGVMLYPDLDGQPEELLAALAEQLATDADEVAQVLESLVPLVCTIEAVHAWRDAAGLRRPGRGWAELWAATRIAVAYLQRFEPAVLAVVQRVADHSLAAHAARLGPSERLLIEAALDADDVDTLDGGALDLLVERPLPASERGSSLAAQVQLAVVRELLLRRLDLDAELARFVFVPRAAVGEPAANEPPGEGRPGLIGANDPSIARPVSRLRARAWAGGISAACEQALIELCPPVHWRRSVRAALARGGVGSIDLWAELADELGFEFSEGSLRGAVNHVQQCTFGLVDELRGDAARYLDRREAPQIQAALANLAEHLHGHCEVEPDDRLEATRLLARAHAAQWRETRGEVIDAGSWWTIAEQLAGDQFAAYFVRFCSGVIASERAAALGRGLGLLAHLGGSLDRDDPRLLRLGPVAIASLVERALGQTRAIVAGTRTPMAVRRRALALHERLGATI